MQSEIIIVPALFFMIGYIVYIVVDGYRRRQQMRVFADFHTKLLERLGSARDFADFFTSDAGSRFLNSLSSSEGGAPQLRILRSMQTGFVLLAVGIGFFIMLDQRTFDVEAVDGLMVVATAATAVGRCTSGVHRHVLSAVEAHGAHRATADQSGSWSGNLGLDRGASR
jgi:hypothetical protein